MFHRSWDYYLYKILAILECSVAYFLNPVRQPQHTLCLPAHECCIAYCFHPIGNYGRAASDHQRLAVLREHCV